MLTDGDWKKLWMEAGNLNPNSKTDNTIDSSDSPVFDDTEVSDSSLDSSSFFRVAYVTLLTEKNKQRAHGFDVDGIFDALDKVK